MKPLYTKLLLTISVINLFGLITLSVIYFSKSDRIVYVESNNLIEGYKGTEAARKSLEAKTLVWKANIDTMNSEVRSDILKFADRAKELTRRERTLQEGLIQSKQQRLHEYQRTIESQMQQQEAEITKTILNEINTYIKKYGEENGYTIIMASTNYGNIAFARPDIDITEEILAGLNQQYVAK